MHNFSDEGRLQILALELLEYNKKVLIVNIYNQNNEKAQVRLLEKLYKKMNEVPNLPDFDIIIGGD